MSNSETNINTKVDELDDGQLESVTGGIPRPTKRRRRRPQAITSISEGSGASLDPSQLASFLGGSQSVNTGVRPGSGSLPSTGGRPPSGLLGGTSPVRRRRRGG